MVRYRRGDCPRGNVFRPDPRHLGALAFVFSTHALRLGARFAPMLRLYRFVLYPLSRPTALLLDLWLGTGATRYLGERDFRALIAQHVKAPGRPEVSALEGTGAVNFLDLDDIPIAHEGEELDPRSILSLPDAARKPPRRAASAPTHRAR